LSTKDPEFLIVFSFPKTETI